MNLAHRPPCPQRPDACPARQATLLFVQACCSAEAASSIAVRFLCTIMTPAAGFAAHTGSVPPLGIQSHLHVTGEAHYLAEDGAGCRNRR
jgi:hypothetical protein